MAVILRWGTTTHEAGHNDRQAREGERKEAQREHGRKKNSTSRKTNQRKRTEQGTVTGIAREGGRERRVGSMTGRNTRQTERQPKEG